jgi:hypothetical protein
VPSRHRKGLGGLFRPCAVLHPLWWIFIVIRVHSFYKSWEVITERVSYKLRIVYNIIIYHLSWDLVCCRIHTYSQAFHSLSYNFFIHNAYIWPIIIPGMSSDFLKWLYYLDSDWLWAGRLRGRVPVGSRIFTFTYGLDHLWGPPNLLSGVHPTSYPMGTGAPFSGGNAAGAWSWPLTSN